MIDEDSDDEEASIILPFQAHIVFWIDGNMISKTVSVSGRGMMISDENGARDEAIYQMTAALDKAIADRKAMETLKQES